MVAVFKGGGGKGANNLYGWSVCSTGGAFYCYFVHCFHHPDPFAKIRRKITNSCIDIRETINNTATRRVYCVCISATYRVASPFLAFQHTKPASAY